MFIGHFAVALAAKKAVPKVSLGTLFIASEFVDILWPIFLFCGIEKAEIRPGDTVFTPLAFVSYPFSHSLMAAVIWGLLVGCTFYLFRRNARSAMIVALVVLSHWFLDFLSHRPDLPLTLGGGSRYGLGLWNSFPGTLLVEVGLFIGGLVLYVQSTNPTDKIGRWGFWSLAGFLLIVYFMNAFGPPPPTMNAVIASAFAMTILFLWAYWADAHRTPVVKSGASTPPTSD
jgi:hypothetical protein